MIMKCRNSVAELTLVQKSQLVQAFLDLKNPARAPSRITAAQAAVTSGGGIPNRYDDYVWMHNTVGYGAHRGPAFGPWHREFLFQLEYDLQQVSGDPDLTLPYWDWTTARSATDPGWPFTNDFMGGFGNAGPGATTGYVTRGPFSNPATWRINIRLIGDADINLKRSRGVPAAVDLPERGDVLFSFGIGVPTGATWPQVYDGAPWAERNGPVTNQQVLGSFRRYLERILHDGVHGWVGDAWELNQTPIDGGAHDLPGRVGQRPGVLASSLQRRPHLVDLAAQGGELGIPAAGHRDNQSRPQRRRHDEQVRRPFLVQHHAAPTPDRRRRSSGAWLLVPHRSS
jgi:hypothetical protein